MSQSEDFACWRWANWSCCRSADSGNSRSFALRPCDEYFALNALTDAFWPPDVSLPVQ